MFVQYSMCGMSVPEMTHDGSKSRFEVGGPARTTQWEMQKRQSQLRKCVFLSSFICVL